MKPRFPDSARVRAPEALVLADGRWRWLELSVRYGVFARPDGSLALVDTGYSARVTAGPRSPALAAYASALRPKLRAEGQALAVVAGLGARPEDVRVVLISHFHADHVSALKDFPQARFYASGAGFARLKAIGPLGRLRHGVFFELLPPDFAARLTALEARPQRPGPCGLPACWDVFGDGACLAAPLPGHALGHMGFVWPEAGVLYAADVEWLAQAAREDRQPGPPARLILADPGAARRSAALAAGFAGAGGTVVWCHDPEGTA